MLSARLSQQQQINILNLCVEFSRLCLFSIFGENVAEAQQQQQQQPQPQPQSNFRRLLRPDTIDEEYAKMKEVL